MIYDPSPPDPSDYNTPLAPQGLRGTVEDQTPAAMPSIGPDKSINFDTQPQQFMQTASRLPPPVVEPVMSRMARTAPGLGYEGMPQYIRALTFHLNQSAREQGIDMGSQDGQQWYQQNLAKGMAFAPNLLDIGDKDRYKELKDGSIIDVRKGTPVYLSAEARANEDYLNQVRGYRSRQSAQAPQPGNNPQIRPAVQMLPSSASQEPSPSETPGTDISPDAAALSPMLSKIREMQIKDQELRDKKAEKADADAKSSRDEQRKDEAAARQDEELKLQQAKADMPTKEMADSKLYADRMQEAESDLANLFHAKFDPTTATSGASGSLPDALNNFKPEHVQQYEQLKRNFINATLRHESGATVTPSELEIGEKQYFPVFGDKPETVKQKARNRQLVVDHFQAFSKPLSQRSQSELSDTKLSREQAAKFVAAAGGNKEKARDLARKAGYHF